MKTFSLANCDIAMSEDIQVVVAIDVIDDKIMQIPFFFNRYDEAVNFIDEYMNDNDVVVIWGNLSGTFGNINGRCLMQVDPGVIKHWEECDIVDIDCANMQWRDALLKAAGLLTLEPVKGEWEHERE